MPRASSSVRAMGQLRGPSKPSFTWPRVSIANRRTRQSPTWTDSPILRLSTSTIAPPWQGVRSQESEENLRPPAAPYSDSRLLTPDFFLPAGVALRRSESLQWRPSRNRCTPVGDSPAPAADAIPRPAAFLGWEGAVSFQQSAVSKGKADRSFPRAGAAPSGAAADTRAAVTDSGHAPAGSVPDRPAGRRGRPRAHSETLSVTGPPRPRGPEKEPPPGPPSGR